jgi:hypothetical protein
VNVTASAAPPAVSVSTVLNVYVFVPMTMTMATIKLPENWEPGNGHSAPTPGETCDIRGAGNTMYWLMKRF